MYCNQCGKEVLDLDRFCNACGAVLSGSASSDVSRSTSNNNSPLPPVSKSFSDDFVYGGFWWRVLAYLIDAIILSIGYWLVALVFGFNGWLFLGADYKYWAAAGVTLVVIYTVLTFIAPWLYYALMESSKFQGTIGKWALKMRVADEEGKQITFARATGRYFAKILSSLTLGIGYIMVAFTERKQGLHDILARTIILKSK
ncbi:MAG: RDD family protein [Gammaproteobacteria bacterium]